MKLVVKVGGSLLKESVPESLVSDLKMVASANQLAVVHGGGDVVTDMAHKLGKEQRFVVSPEGIRSRYTDRETVDIYTMVMSGLVAKKLVLSLAKEGIRPVSITGLDGALLAGSRKKRLAVIDDRGRKVLVEGGFTGKIDSVNGGLASTLMEAGYTPIVSPVAIGEEFEPLNVDGDRAAASLAVGIGADVVVFLTNVAGLTLDGSLVQSISCDEAARRLPEVGFGMQKKVMAAVDAVRGGVGEAVVCSGLGESPVTTGLAHRTCTVISK
ncbi:MAG TPA: [LysW]-aminoadipate/[LysW]-glutamate kinase [Nitrososphaerales archaeon]|nr:[LysW]-aminoadipate/[LysW]-glutamate kinase [Nitrososphaerales archaeon]